MSSKAECTGCDFETELTAFDSALPYCPECGKRVEIETEYTEVEETKSDLV